MTKKNSKKLLSLMMACGMLLSSNTLIVNASDEPITLTVSHFNTLDTRAENADCDAFWTMVEKYQEEHPNVTLELQEMAQTDYEVKVQAQAAAGELPDIFFMKGSWGSNFVANDNVYDLAAAIDGYDKKDTYMDGIFDAVTRGDSIYGMPLGATVSHLVYYNEALWKEAGYDTFPTTWEDLYAAVEKFEEMGISPITFGNVDAWPAESCILSTYADRYTGTDWTYSIINNDGNAKFTDQEFVDSLAALQKMKELFNPDYNTLTNEQAQALFCSGEAATIIEGIWVVAYINANATEEVAANTNVAILPPVEGGKGDAATASGGAGWFMAMNSNLAGTEKEQAALDFMLQVCGYDYAEFVAENYGSLSHCVVEGTDMSAFPLLTQRTMELMNTVAFTPIYDSYMDASVIEVMNKGLQTLLNGEITPEELAANIQAEQDLLKK